MKPDKTIEFGYEGGEYEQKMKVRSENLPIKADCDSEWLSAYVKLPYVTIKAAPNYGIGGRCGFVALSDRFGNKIAIAVNEGWFSDVRIECPEEINIPYTYYDTHDTYDIYVTVYGGPTKAFKTKGLTKMTQMVWNISDTYRDYIVRIPQSVSGNFTFTHKDAAEYEEYCNDNGIEYNENAVKKKVRIRQIGESDTNGEIEISVCGKTASLGNPCEAPIEFGSSVCAEVVKCSYVTVTNEGSVSETTEDTLSVSGVPDWMTWKYVPGGIEFSALSSNPFANEKRADIKLSSPSNPRLFAIVTLVQKSSAVRD